MFTAPLRLYKVDIFDLLMDNSHTSTMGTLPSFLINDVDDMFLTFADRPSLSDGVFYDMTLQQHFLLDKAQLSFIFALFTYDLVTVARLCITFVKLYRSHSAMIPLSMTEVLLQNYSLYTLT